MANNIIPTGKPTLSGDATDVGNLIDKQRGYKKGPEAAPRSPSTGLAHVQKLGRRDWSPIDARFTAPTKGKRLTSGRGGKR